MTNNDVWPVVFVGWNSKAAEFFDAVRKGQIDVWTGKLHARKGAAFVAVLEDGRIVAIGSLANVAGNLHELSINKAAFVPEGAPVLKSGLIDKVLAIPKPFLKGPVTAFPIPSDKKDGVLDRQWFDEVVPFAEAALAAGRADLPPKVAATARATEKEGKERQAASTQPAAEEESEALLKGWIPPVLQGLLADHVRADQWELVVAYAFRALGCQVQYLGQKAGPKAVPDCIARYTSPAGQVIELIIDAKAGQWNGAVDDIRAMRDYVNLATPYSYPLFVANSLTKDTDEKLRQHIMHGKTARAISGRDLALLIVQRLTDPNFNVEFELRRFFL